MRITKSITLIAAAAIFLASCAKTEYIDENVKEGLPASLKITLSGEKLGTRAIEDETFIENESKIYNYTVFVISAITNKIQAVSEFVEEPELTSTINGLTSGPKKIFVLANFFPPENFKVGDDYSTLINPREDYYWVDYFVLNSGGAMTMSGEVSINLAPGHNTLEETIKVKRVAAKVKLGTVTFDPEPGYEGDFQLEEAVIMKTADASTFGPGEIFMPEWGPITGGIAGNVSIYEAYHYRAFIDNDDYAGRFFYVAPNNNFNGNATLLTLVARFNGELFYYPIRINDGTGGSNGKFIERNAVYTVNFKIKRPGLGSKDPEVPVDPATLDLTIGVEPWNLVLDQNVEI